MTAKQLLKTPLPSEGVCPHEWLCLDAFTSGVNGFFFLPHDFFGSGRQEVCIFGRRGVEFRNNL